MLAAPILAATATQAQAYGPQGPNDPEYNFLERNPSQCATSSVSEEQFYFYSFIPVCTKATAHDPENSAGMFIDQAWNQYSTGSPETVIAYVEGGINWHHGDAQELADKVFLNWRELPVPGTNQRGSSVADYDLDRDGSFTASDYKKDPRVKDFNGNGVIDPEDVIVAFSCFDAANQSVGAITEQNPDGSYGCSNGAQNVDNDGNGYPHDISGWDFYHHQNDPATYDAAYGHANSQMKQAAAQTDNGFQGAGLCPACLIMPVKAGAEALDRTDDLAQAWLYASDLGADVIVSVTADLGYSTFMKQAIDHVWRNGTVMVQASNDFDSTDHQGGMFHPHVLPGNGIVANSDGIPGGAANAATTNFRTRSGLTSWGTHNMFSAPNRGGSTSESTPTVGGVMALLMAYGRQAAAKGLIKSPLVNEEAIQVARATASNIDDPSLAWPGRPGAEWNLQYGYGRPNVLKAMQAISTGAIPPIAAFTGPDWYSLYDPTSTSEVPVDGVVGAPRSGAYSYEVQYALGPEPLDSQWQTFATGSGTGRHEGRLGTLDLARIPASFWTAPFTTSKTKTLETSEQYTVSLRVRVTDAQGRVGEERRSIAVHHDPTALSGFPKLIGPSGEAAPALADLEGKGRLDIVFGDADGVIHAIDPQTGRDIPGWPVTTDATAVQRQHPGVNPGHEPVIAPAAVGDLDHNGSLEVVVTSLRGKVYVFDAGGKRRAGWPKVMADGVAMPPRPRPSLPHTRLPQQGATAAPVLYPLQGGKQLDVIQAAWDGRLHVWQPDGSNAPGWPVEVKPPDGPPDPGHFYINDHKLDAPPAVALLDGKRPALVERSQWTQVVGDGVQPNGIGLLHAYWADGAPVAGYPVKMSSIIEYYGSAQEFITEGSNTPIAGDISGDGRDAVISNPVFAPSYLVRDAHVALTYGPVPDASAAMLSNPGAAATTPTGNLPADAPIGFTTSGALGRYSGALTFTQPGTGSVSMATSLLTPGSGTAIKNYTRAYSAAGAASLPGFPAQLQGLDFLGAPAIADVTGDGLADILAGADTSALQAYTAGALEATGFPKFTTGWTIWSPSVGDLFGDGHNDVVAMTREGYLMAWRTPGLATSSEWWATGHDEWHTGRYGTDTRPPGALRDVRWQPGKAVVSFLAPGDNWYDGRADHYLVSFDGRQVSVPATVAAGGTQSIAVPPLTASIAIQAVDGAGNLGRLLTLKGGNEQ